MRASQWEQTDKPKGEAKAKVGRGREATLASRRPLGGWVVLVAIPHSRGVSIRHRRRRSRVFVRCRRRTSSAHAGTRKMVNYAWSGRSQGKP